MKSTLITREEGGGLQMKIGTTDLIEITKAHTADIT
jgi:hypothetical protein